MRQTDIFNKMFKHSVSLNILWKILFSLILVLTFASCHYTNDSDAWAVNSDAEVDSVDFRKTHHYWTGYNFVAADSMWIISRPPFDLQLAFASDDSTLIKARDVLVVEEIRRDTSSKPFCIWLKIAAVETSPSIDRTDEIASSGWIQEVKLMKKVVPDTPVSKIIHKLSSKSFKSMLWILAIVLCLLGVSFFRRKTSYTREINCLYLPLLYIVLSGAIVLHRSIWHFVPDTWVEYYFYPTLNPFNQLLPPVMSLFIFLIWLLVLLWIAVIDDIRRKISNFARLVTNLLLFGGHCIMIFAAFAVVIPFTLLYPLLLMYWTYVIYQYRKHNRKKIYYCGNCGALLHELGTCPECEAQND